MKEVTMSKRTAIITVIVLSAIFYALTTSVVVLARKPPIYINETCICEETLFAVAPTPIATPTPAVFFEEVATPTPAPTPAQTPTGRHEVNPLTLPQIRPLVESDRKRGVTTFVMLGLDMHGNTDAIMVASYNEVTREAHIVSIPRDTYVDVSRNVKKINAAYNTGRRRGGIGGIEQVKIELEDLIGFVPDYYVTVSFKGLERLIDAIGGVEIDVPFRMRYDDPAEGLIINFQPGVQHMNGADAVKFARYRLSNDGFRGASDQQRMDHQQQVLQAVKTQILTPASILKIPEFISIFFDNVDTDITMARMVRLAAQVLRIEEIHMHTLPNAGSVSSPIWYSYLDGPATVELLNRTINPFTRDIKLEDLNIRRP
jgi:LCP family protein required for cell wall assembly